MVNKTGALTGPLPVLDDAFKEFFTNLLQTSMAGLQASINEVTKSVQNNSIHIDNMMVTQQYLNNCDDKVILGGNKMKTNRISEDKKLADNMFDEMPRVKSLKQEGSVQEYYYSFNSLINKMGLYELYVIDMFILGLKPEIYKGVSIFKPKNLSDAYRLAQLQETTNELMKKKNINPSFLPTYDHKSSSKPTGNDKCSMIFDKINGINTNNEAENFAKSSDVENNNIGLVIEKCSKENAKSNEMFELGFDTRMEVLDVCADVNEVNTNNGVGYFTKSSEVEDDNCAKIPFSLNLQNSEIEESGSSLAVRVKFCKEESIDGQPCEFDSENVDVEAGQFKGSRPKTANSVGVFEFDSQMVKVNNGCENSVRKVNLVANQEMSSFTRSSVFVGEMVNTSRKSITKRKLYYRVNSQRYKNLIFRSCGNLFQIFHKTHGEIKDNVRFLFPKYHHKRQNIQGLAEEMADEIWVLIDFDQRSQYMAFPYFFIPSSPTPFNQTSVPKIPKAKDTTSKVVITHDERKHEPN